MCGPVICQPSRYPPHVPLTSDDAHAFDGARERDCRCKRDGLVTAATIAREDARKSGRAGSASRRRGADVPSASTAAAVRAAVMPAVTAPPAVPAVVTTRADVDAAVKARVRTPERIVPPVRAIRIAVAVRVVIAARVHGLDAQTIEGRSLGDETRPGLHVPREVELR